MDTPPEKEYINGEVRAAIERFSDDARARQIALNARLDRLDQTIAEGLKRIRDDLNAGLAHMPNSQNNQTKWIIGTIIAVAVICTSITSVMLAQVAPTTNTPIVIYIQPH